MAQHFAIPRPSDFAGRLLARRLTHLFRAGPFALCALRHMPCALGLFVLTLVAGFAVPAAAQSDFDVVGTRAQGMGGAFVAVADDASAGWWNPAGLSSIPIADASVSGGVFSTAGDTDDAVTARTTGWRASPISVFFGLPVLGVSYNHLTVTDIRPAATATAEPGRQEDTGTAAGRVLRTQYLDATLAQSIGDVLVVGTTLGVVSGETASVRLPSGGSIDDAFSTIRDLPADGHARFDAHVGALAFFRAVRLGVVVRNLAAPRFDDASGGSIRLPRQVRVGAAIGGGRPAYQRREWSVALDADLTTVDAADGRRRAVSVGVERWLASRRVGVRGGARVQTIDASRAAVSGGLSVAVRSGTYVEALVSGGADRAAAGWQLAGRVTF
jgi:hypothetical protein